MIAQLGTRPKLRKMHNRDASSIVQKGENNEKNLKNYNFN